MNNETRNEIEILLTMLKSTLMKNAIGIAIDPKKR